MVCNVLMLWRPCAEAKKRKAAVLWHMQSDVLITRIGMITTTPPIPERNKLKGLHWKSPHFFFFQGKPHLVVIPCCISASVVFVHNSHPVFEICACFIRHLLTWGRAASVPQRHNCDKTQTHKRLIRKDGVWVMCVFSLFADGRPRSMSWCTSLTRLHNECVDAKMPPKNLTVHYPAF